jgi:hypothetical protein
LSTGKHFHPQFDGRVAVGHGLGLDALGGVHHQQCPFAGRQGAGHLIGKVHVAGGVDEVDLVFLAVPGLVEQGGGLGLDGDAPLPLQVHGIQYLLLHLPFFQAAAAMDDAVRQGGLAVVDVGDDGEVADMGLHEKTRGTEACL